MLHKEKGFLWKQKRTSRMLLTGNKSCDSWCWRVKTHRRREEHTLSVKITYHSYNMALDTDLQFVVEPLEWPAISEVVLRMPRAGGGTPSSAWVRGTELARVETRRRSGWSSLRLRRRWLRLGSLKLRPLSRLIRLWETTSSKRSRCFLGMKILANIAESEIIQREKKSRASSSAASEHHLNMST